MTASSKMLQINDFMQIIIWQHLLILDCFTVQKEFIQLMWWG